MIPQGLSILSASFSGEERGRAIGTWSAWTGVFAAVGPVVGGWLLQVWSWRLIFVLNLPLALLVLVLAPCIPRAVVEWTASAAAGTGWARCWLLQPSPRSSSPLSFAPEIGWRNLRVLAPLIGGGALLAAFLWSQAGRANRDDATVAVSYSTLSGGEPAYFPALQRAVWRTVCDSVLCDPGAALSAGGGWRHLSAYGGDDVLLLRAGGRSSGAGGRALACWRAGAACAGVGFCLFAVLSGMGSYWRSLLPGVLLLGVGLTLAVAPLTTAVMSSVAQSQTGIASAVNNALSRLAGLVAGVGADVRAGPRIQRAARR